jgi:hypothetical protein
MASDLVDSIPSVELKLDQWFDVGIGQFTVGGKAQRGVHHREVLIGKLNCHGCS